MNIYFNIPFFLIHADLLHFSGHVDMVKFLVMEGANKDAVNESKQGAVQIAVANNDVAMLKTLRNLEFNVNQKVNKP